MQPFFKSLGYIVHSAPVQYYLCCNVKETQKYNVPHFLISALGIEPKKIFRTARYRIPSYHTSEIFTNTYSYNATDEYFAYMGYIANFLCVDLKAIGYELYHYLPLPVMIICFFNTSSLYKAINNREIQYVLNWKNLLGSTAYRHKCLAIVSLIFKEILTPEYQSFRIFRIYTHKGRIVWNTGT